MKFSLKSLLLTSCLPFMAACASAEFPQSGTPSPYDGMWSAQLPADRTVCDGIESKFEIRYGMVIGTVTEKGRRIADIWGQLDEKGHLEGLIGQLGITGATASVNFQPNSASGTWKNKSCDGTVSAQKTG